MSFRLVLCLKQLHVVHIKVFYRMQYFIRLLLFYSVIFQSVIFHSCEFQSPSDRLLSRSADGNLFHAVGPCTAL